MASPRVYRFQREDIRLAKYAKALSHPARIVILRSLASWGTSGFGEISKEIPLADSTVSQHLFELKKAGLIIDTYEPPRIKYSINNKDWKAARKILKEFMKVRGGNTQRNK